MTDRRYTSTHSQIQHLMKMNGQPHAPAAFTLGKAPQVAIEQEAGRVPESVWKLRTKKIFLSSPENRTTIRRLSRP